MKIHFLEEKEEEEEVKVKQKKKFFILGARKNMNE